MGRVTNEVIVERIGGLKTLTSEKFNQVNKRLDTINNRLNKHGERLDIHGSVLTKNETEIKQLNKDNQKARSGIGKVAMKVLGMF